MPRKRRTIPWLELRDEVYYVYWHPADGGRIKRLSLGTGEPVEAQQRFAKFLAGGQATFDAHPGGSPGLTVSQALDDYYREHVAVNVVDKIRAEDCIRHLKGWFKNAALSSIDIPTSRSYAAARRMGVIGGGKRRKDGKASDSTIRRELVVLVAAANHAEKWKRVKIGEMPSIELPQEAAQEEIYLTQAELARAREAATGRLRAFMDVAYYTAARRESVERLTKFQVNLAQGRINLTAPTETANQRRSKKRRPVVPIDPKLRPTIEALMDDSPNEWVFGSPASMYRPFRTHLEKLGLGAKAFPHVLRHSRATHLLQSGVQIYDVAKLLGDTVATVQRVYGHHCPDYLAAAIKGSGQ